MTYIQKVFRAGILLTVFFSAGAQRAFADGVSDTFTQTNLVSDIPGIAANTDPQLVNPWGVSFSPTSPFWVSDNGAGVSTLYDGTGAKQGLVVTVPGPLVNMPSAPTGQVFNPNPGDFLGSHFIFATEDGTISAWSSGTTATVEASPSAIYKGLALATNGGNSFLYAANFLTGTIDVFDNKFHQATLSGGFIDPNLPAGYAPFNVQNINGKLYVTYALRNGKDDLAGAGHGFLDVFSTDGVFLQRLISQGQLNSPWGLTLAPSGFGKFGGDLLVGNFGDGTINAFDPSTGAFLGKLDGTNGMPLVNLGLWALKFGNGFQAGGANELFFTAGIPGDGEVEDHGLFGKIDSTTSTPEPGIFTLLVGGMLFISLASIRKKAITGLNLFGQSA
jgi:uncharacterized protein (TIGR03118 family)